MALCWLNVAGVTHQPQTDAEGLFIYFAVLSISSGRLVFDQVFGIKWFNTDPVGKSKPALCTSPLLFNRISE